MAMITLTEFKATQYYRTAMSDAIISQMITQAERDFLKIRNNPFIRIKGDIVKTTDTISNVSASDYRDTSFNPDYIEEGDLITDKTNAKVNNYIVYYDYDNNSIILDSNVSASADETELELIVYPANSKTVIARMIYYIYSESELDPSLKSESIEKHSMTRFSDTEMIGGYPKSIVGSIKRYLRSSGGKYKIYPEYLGSL